MKTQKFLSAFGNPYEVEVLPQSETIRLIDELDQEAILTEMIKQYVGIGRMEALFNSATGEVEYHQFIENTDLREKAHLVLLHTLTGDLEEGLEEKDFLDEDEINENGDLAWPYIWKLEDYEERLIAAHIYHWRGFDMDRVKDRIRDVYV